MIITKTFEFDAAHNIKNKKNKCEKLHGHTYRLDVSLKGDVGRDGMVKDFLEIKKIVEKKVIGKIDHSYLNDIMKQPTAENIAIWIWNKLEDCFKNSKLHEIKVYESKTSWVSYRGEDG